MDAGSIIGVCCRLTLAAVFTTAAIGKTFDRAETERAAIELRMPQRIAVAVGWALPAAELLLAAGLILAARPASVAAGCLLFLFNIAAVVVGTGSAPSCGCFGALGASKPRLPVLVRNLALLAAAGISAGTTDTPTSRLATVVVVSGTVAVAVPVSWARASHVDPERKGPPSRPNPSGGAAATYLLVVEEDCATCGRLLAHLEGALTGTEPLQVVTRGELAAGRLPTSMVSQLVARLPHPALAVLDAVGAAVRPPVGGIGTVFAMLEAEILPGADADRPPNPGAGRCGRCGEKTGWASSKPRRAARQAAVPDRGASPVRRRTRPAVRRLVALDPAADPALVDHLTHRPGRDRPAGDGGLSAPASTADRRTASRT
jgi:hypothetical protein